MNLPKSARRILIVQDYLRSGGTERQSLLLAREFAAAGREVSLLRFRPGGTLAGEIPAGVQTCALQPFDLRLDWFAPGLRRAVQKIAPDAVLCMGRMANCYAARIKAAVSNAAVVCTMRTGKTLPAAYQRGLATADAVVANSAAAAAILARDYGVNPAKVRVIYNAPVFAPEDPAVAAEIPSENGGGSGDGGGVRNGGEIARPVSAECVLLNVAMFRPEKNHRGLLRVLARLPETLRWRLVLAGDGPERRACEDFARSVPALAKRVSFAGFQADPRPLYRAADVAVLTSLRESLPNFLVEAHLHGVPSVAYAAGGVAECGGVSVPQGDEAAFEAALRRILEDGVFRGAEAKRVRVFAREHFTRTAQTDAHLRLFDGLLGAPNCRI